MHKHNYVKLREDLRFVVKISQNLHHLPNFGWLKVKSVCFVDQIFEIFGITHTTLKSNNQIEKCDIWKFDVPET